jgi:hypothetical protein
MSISIFAKRHFRARRDGHLQRVSSIIRGYQIAEYLGAKLNPTEGFESDVCIYVKPHVKPVDDIPFYGHAYLDIIDGNNLIHLAQKHPDVSVITCSYASFSSVTSQINNKVILIPQHHCNFERFQKKGADVLTVGCIGTKSAFVNIPPQLIESIKALGIHFIEFSNFQSREDIVDFYKKIDVQMVWRPYMREASTLSNPLKIVNAASFGVPTIALDEMAFYEMKGYYFPVETEKEFIDQLIRLKSSTALYSEYSEKCFKKAENYHITRVGKLYKDLV